MQEWSYKSGSLSLIISPVKATKELHQMHSFLAGEYPGFMDQIGQPNSNLESIVASELLFELCCAATCIWLLSVLLTSTVNQQAGQKIQQKSTTKYFIAI